MTDNSIKGGSGIKRRGRKSRGIMISPIKKGGKEKHFRGHEKCSSNSSTKVEQNKIHPARFR